MSDTGSFTLADLAARAGASAERIEDLTARGVLIPLRDGTYAAGDVHRVRAIDAFEAAGVPIDVLVKAQDQGAITFAYYDELHARPGPPAPRTYAQFQGSLESSARWLTPLYGAFGLAEPEGASRLSVDEEAFLAEMVAIIASIPHPDLVLRLIRLFGESARRSAEAALTTYGEAVEREDHDLRGLPSMEVYERVFSPWARLARAAPQMASWLTMQHVSRAIDAYSVEATESLLEEQGFVPERPDIQPAIAFVDLTGFTRLAQERGDETAATIAIRLGEVAGRVAQPHRGRVVKLLGDGVLVRFPDMAAALDASLDMLDALPAEGLPPGHIGAHRGPIIARDGDVFGRTVNMAARIADAAAAGELWIAADLAVELAERFVADAAGTAELPGIGAVRLARIRRRG